MSDIFNRQPARSFLRERETYVPRKKLVDIIERSSPLTHYAEPMPLPAGVRPEQAIEVVAGGTWARGIAEGVCGPGYAGFTQGSTEWQACVYNVSHRVAARTLGLSWNPPTTPPTRPRRRET